MPKKPNISSLKKISMLLLDVDGVMTDGGLYFTESGDELKKFNIQDGYGIVKWQRLGGKVGIITGRVSTLVSRRADELGIRDVYQNLDNKIEAYEKVLASHHLTDAQVAYIGDDEPDLPLVQRVGFSACPNDAVDGVRRSVHYVCKRAGGEGAVREVIDVLLKAQRHGT